MEEVRIIMVAIKREQGDKEVLQEVIKEITEKYIERSHTHKKNEQEGNRKSEEDEKEKKEML